MTEDQTSNIADAGLESIQAASAGQLIATLRGDALWLTLNNVGALNALTPKLIAGLDVALDVAERDRGLTALVITGAGSTFCPGADLKAVLGMGGDAEFAFKSFLTHVGHVFRRLENLSLPTVAAVNGLALAGGLELALCCDFVVAGQQGRIGEGHAKYGQIPGGGGSARLVRKIGASRAKYLMFSGEILSPEHAHALGLVDVVASAEGLGGAVDDLLAKFADKSPLVLARMKALVHDSLDQPLDLALRAEISTSIWHAHSFDRNEGLEAFAQKRRPQYRGN